MEKRIDYTKMLFMDEPKNHDFLLKRVAISDVYAKFGKVRKVNLLYQEKFSLYSIFLEDGRKFILKTSIIKNAHHIEIMKEKIKIHIAAQLISQNVLKIIDTKFEKKKDEYSVEMLFEYAEFLERAKFDNIPKSQKICAINKFLDSLCEFEKIGLFQGSIKNSELFIDETKSIIKLAGFLQLYFNDPTAVFQPMNNPEISNKSPLKPLTSENSKIILQKIDMFRFGLIFLKFVVNKNIKPPIEINRLEKCSGTGFLQDIEKMLKLEGEEKYIKLMKSCLNNKQELRPKFSEFKSEFDKILIKDSEIQLLVEQQNPNIKPIFYKNMGIECAELSEFIAAIWNCNKYIELCKQNEEIIEKVTYAVLGFCHINIEKKDQGLEYIRNILQIISKKSYKELLSSDIIWTYFYIAKSYKLLKDYEKSLDFYMQSLNYANSYNPQFPLIITIYYEIATVYFCEGKYENSLENNFKAISAYANLKYDLENIEFVRILENIANCYNQLEIKSQACEFYSKSFNAYKNSIFKEIEENIKSYENLISTYTTKRDFDNSILYYQKALDIFNSKIKEKILYAFQQNLIGFEYSHYFQNYSDSICYFLEALSVSQNLYGSKSLKCAEIYQNLGYAFLNNLNFVSAKENYLKSEQIMQNYYHISSPELKILYSEMGLLYEKVGDLYGSDNYYSKIIQF